MNLFEIGREIEALLERQPLPKARLASLMQERQELLDRLGEVPEREARQLLDQNKRLLQKCRQAMNSLDGQLERMSQRNDKKRLAQASSRYFDGRC